MELKTQEELAQLPNKELAIEVLKGFEYKAKVAQTKIENLEDTTDFDVLIRIIDNDSEEVFQYGQLLEKEVTKRTTRSSDEH